MGEDVDWIARQINRHGIDGNRHREVMFDVLDSGVIGLWLGINSDEVGRGAYIGRSIRVEAYWYRSRGTREWRAVRSDVGICVDMCKKI